ncbi:MAG TPA: NAD(+) synthase [Polyangiaceae bacterium]|nr:NAD(+) synthase [Polyangiaceae bacterium]
MGFSEKVLELDAAAETDRIAARLRDQVCKECKRRGAVIALSGGIDSSVVAGLCARALGPKRCIGLLMPERDSSEDTLAISRSVAEAFGFEWVHEDATPMLEGMGCYRRRDEAIRRVFPEFGEGYRFKIVLPGLSSGKTYNVYSIVIERPDGEQIKQRLPLDAYLQIVAATNFKQRVRKTMEYYYADKLHYVVTGTPNRLEYDQGFFVKNGDGSADVKPIAHLYKTQVYQLADYLGVPTAVSQRPPTTDTYSLSQGQDEFYFALPHRQMDLCLWAKNHGVPAAEVAPVVELTVEQVEWVYADIDKKRATTRYMHLPPLLIEEVDELRRP